MNRIQNIFELARIIAKRIISKMGASEEERLKSWEQEATRNRELIERISSRQNFEARNEVYESVDTDKAWQELSKKTHKSNKPFPVFYQYAAAVAVIILMIGGGLMFFYIDDKEEDLINEIHTASIQPGTKNAVIMLDNGESFNLENGSIESLVEKDGSVISNQKGELNYSNLADNDKDRDLRNTLFVPRGGEYNLVLSDGSRIYLNSMSELVYPVVFNEDIREVSLKGEAYFEVAKDSRRPFYVNVNGMRIRVLGTSFNVKAYDDEANIYTTLVEGKVQINAEGSEKDWFLSPNHQAVLSKSDRTVEMNKVDVQKFVEWRSGMYCFANQPIENIIQELSRWYDFEYSFASEDLKKIRFEGGLNKYDDIRPILEIMHSTGKLNYKIEGKKIIFTRE